MQRRGNDQARVHAARREYTRHARFRSILPRVARSAREKPVASLVLRGLCGTTVRHDLRHSARGTGGGQGGKDPRRTSRQCGDDDDEGEDDVAYFSAGETTNRQEVLSITTIIIFLFFSLVLHSSKTIGSRGSQERLMINDSNQLRTFKTQNFLYHSTNGNFEKSSHLRKLGQIYKNFFIPIGRPM